LQEVLRANIGTYAGKQKNKVAIDTFALQARFAENNESAQRRLDSDGGLLYREILAELRKRNDKLIKSLTTEEGLLDPKKVAEVQWENDFKPLTWADIRQIWIDMQQKKANAINVAINDDMSLLQKEMFGLCDVGYLVVRRASNGRSGDHIPFCNSTALCAQLFAHTHRKVDDNVEYGLTKVSREVWLLTSLSQFVRTSSQKVSPAVREYRYEKRHSASPQSLGLW